MSEAPERIWATEDAKNFGEDRFHTTIPMNGLTEYIRADIHAAELTRLRAKVAHMKEALDECASALEDSGKLTHAWDARVAANGETE